MSSVFHRMPNKSLPIAVAGEGIEIIDSSGKRYIDASGGAAVSCLGHSHQRVIDAIARQARRLTYAHTSFFTSEAAEALAERLVKAAPPGIGHAYFVSGGSEAIEAALKLARQYFVEIGEPERTHFIARRQSYHGNTLGALAIGGNARRRQPFLPLLIEAHHVSPCYAYRDRLADESDEAYAQRLADELERKILELGTHTVAAFVAETVVGATLGAVPPVAGYFSKIRAVCDKYGEKLLSNVQARDHQLRSALREWLGEHPHVGDIRGRGLFVGVELVRDRASKTPFEPSRKLHATIKQEAMARGLMVYPMGGTIDGKLGDHVLLAPPFICTPNDIDRIVERLRDAIDAALAVTSR